MMTNKTGIPTHLEALSPVRVGDRPELIGIPRVYACIRPLRMIVVPRVAMIEFTPR
jgi:hypothetical protein